MKRCVKCHTIYSSYAAACPKCGVAAPPSVEAEYQQAVIPDDKQVKRDWLWLIIGIPVLIGILYLIVWLIKLMQ